MRPEDVFTGKSSLTTSGLTYKGEFSHVFERVVLVLVITQTKATQRPVKTPKNQSELESQVTLFVQMGKERLLFHIRGSLPTELITCGRLLPGVTQDYRAKNATI